MKRFLSDVLAALLFPWKLIGRLPEGSRLRLFDRHTLAGLLILPAIIGAFFLVFVALSPSDVPGAAGGGELPAPQAGLMAAMADGMVETPPASVWLPRVLAAAGVWLVSGIVAGFVLACLVCGLYVMVLLAGGRDEPVELSQVWRLSSMTTLLLPLAAGGLVAWAGTYVDLALGHRAGLAAKIVLAIAATGWATGAFWAVAWTVQRAWTRAGRLRAGLVALVFAVSCWLVVLTGNFLATKPFQWLGLGFTDAAASIPAGL